MFFETFGLEFGKVSELQVLADEASNALGSAIEEVRAALGEET